LPSGVLADYWSRKHVIMAGGVLRTLGFITWIVWPTFTGYALGFALWGATIACTSGAAAAYLHNELRAIHKDKLYAKFFGWMMSSYSAGRLVGFILASILTLRHVNILIGLSAASSFMLTLSLLGAPEHPYKKQATYLKTLRAGVQEVVHFPKLRYICYGAFSTFMIIGVLEELLPRIYAQFGFNDTAVSLTLAFSVTLTILLLTRLESLVHFSLPKQVLSMAAAVGLLLLGLWVGGIGGGVLILLFSLVFQLFRALFIHHIQDVATGEERATIGSIPGLGAGLLGAGAYWLMGRLSETRGELQAIGVYGGFWLVALLALAYMGRKYRVIETSKADPLETLGPVPGS